MIELENVSKRYDRKAAIEKMDLRIPRGRIYGLIGPNGAGKTTALKMMATLIKPDEGTVRIGGLDLPARVAEARRSIGTMADRQGNFRGLTAEEYLAFFGRLHGISGPSLAARIRTILELTDLGPVREDRVSALSMGMRQRLVFLTKSEGPEGPLVLPRVFVIWQEAEPRPALESPDIVYDPESRRQAFTVRELDVVIPDVPPEKNTKEE